MSYKREITVALVGNPNAGKTSVFNMVAGTHQRVGNFPGCTVEKKEGFIIYEGYRIKLIDLPGTYSLTTYSLEEKIVVDYLLDEKPDLILNVVDSSNLVRNLYLTFQCLELSIPMVVVFNMFDEFESKGNKLDIDKFSELLGRKVVRSIATKSYGKDDLLKSIVKTIVNTKPAGLKLPYYSPDIEEHICDLDSQKSNILTKIDINDRWLIIRLLEKDLYMVDKLREDSLNWESFYHKVFEARDTIRTHFKTEPKAVLIDERYALIHGLIKETILTTTQKKESNTEKIDNIVLNKYLGFPIFLLLMYITFQMTFTVGDIFTGYVEDFFGFLKSLLYNLPPGDYRELLTDGIIGGVGGVLVFVPQIFILFLFLSILEESGYMPRAAFVMDNLMHHIGLHGKSFLPMLIGFGCNVPAIMSTRILNDEKDRLTTIMVIPLMSCNARLPVYVMLSAAFFAGKAGLVIFSLYLAGILLSIIMAKLFRTTLFKGKDSPFVMELPPYRFPTVRALFIHTWARLWMYIKKAGTIILVLSIVVWYASNYTFPWQEATNVDDLRNRISSLEKQSDKDDSMEKIESKIRYKKLVSSIFGQVGKFMEPVFEPLGFDWKMSSTLIAGFGAKELIVSTFGIIYRAGNIEEDDDYVALQKALRNDPEFGYTETKGLVPYTFLLFILIYVPCLAVIGIVKKETNSWKWTLFLIVYTVTLAWVVSFLVYQIGKLFF